MLFPTGLIGKWFAVGITVAGTAVTDIDGINTGLFQYTGNFNAFRQGQEALHRGHFITTHPNQNRIIAVSFSNPGNNLGQKAGSVRGTSTILILPPIIVFAEKLGNKIAMGPVEFHRIVPGFLASTNCINKFLLHPFYVFQSHFLGQGTAISNGHCAWGQILPPGELGIGCGSTMV